VSFPVAPCADLEEYAQAFLAIGQYLAVEATEERVARLARNLPPERMLAAREQGRVVGAAGSFPFRLTIPGNALPAAGVTLVGTYPTHRRRGVLRSLMRAQLDDLRERGEPLACLWASQETIYGRFGYGMASLNCSMALPREHAAYARPLQPRGRVRLLSGEEALALFPPVWDAVRSLTSGMFTRSRAWWEDRVVFDPPDRREGAGPKRFAVLELDGEALGYAVYRHRPGWEDGVSTATLEVLEAIAADGWPTAEIWRYLLDVDWTAQVTCWLLPVDHPLLHLLAEPRRMKLRIGDGLWLRLVEVGQALSARAYAEDGAVVFQVADDFCPWNEGRWKVEGGEARRARAAADLALDVAALGSAYLGGFTFAQLVRAGRVEELRPGAAARADALFRADRAPWCPEVF
jgi:predicted acetyltransferase